MEQLTKYEQARIIGTRAMQISMGAPLFVKLAEKDLQNMRYSPIEIAKMEFQQELIPVGVKRPMPAQKKKEQQQVHYFDQTKLE